MSRKIVAGNWKMHHGPGATRDFLSALEVSGGAEGPEVVLFPPALSFSAAREVLGSQGGVHLGVQNVHWESEGAFTGELSVGMAREAGAHYALVGHSERRQLFGETDAWVTRKVQAVLEGELRAMACVGETLEERDEGRLEEVLRRQTRAALRGLSKPAHRPRLALAYEPVWAIGTGRTATPEDASGAHTFIREVLTDELGPDGAKIPILYGGSVKPGNARELMGAQDVDGVLVGGASLEPDSFRAIIEAA